MLKDISKAGLMELFMALLMVVALLVIARGAAILTISGRVEKKQAVVVVDAGHGGDDPGKVAVNQRLEKDINLSVALKLKNLLEANDVKVVLTRTDDSGLYAESDNNKKVQDMKKRVEIIDEAAPALTVSIHQNSYHEEYVKGAQVFYHAQSEEGKALAETLQKQLVENLDKENNRVAKANDTYYLLKKTSVPIVIVECGFLSNWEEAALLEQDDYQERVAWAVHMGIMQYLNQTRRDR